MGIYASIPGMVQESLLEKLVLSKFAIDYRKNPNAWGSGGCLGHPALTLLMSIADTIGSYVLGGSVRDHFNILDDPNYYNLGIGQTNISTIYGKYRSFQTHNSTLAVNCNLDINSSSNVVFDVTNNMPTIYLEPFYNSTERVLGSFLPNSAAIIQSSAQHQRIVNTP